MILLTRTGRVARARQNPTCTGRQSLAPPDAEGCVGSFYES